MIQLALKGFVRVLGVVLLATQVVHAADAPYPNKPISLALGYPPGGSTDLVARTIAQKLGERLKQSIVVENYGGAGGTIGAKKVVEANPDGYSLLLGTSSEISIARLTNANVKYDGEKDLTPIGLVATSPMVFVAGTKLKANTLDEFVQLAKDNPGKLAFASAGVATPLHLAGEQINQRAGIHMTHVPYRGAGQMVTDVLGGQIETSVFMLSSALPHIKSGKMRALGVTEAKRSPAAPDIPALAENKAFKGVDMGVFYGLFVPAKTPQAIVDLLNKELNEVLKSPDTVAKLSEAGFRVNASGGTPAQFGTLIRQETEKYRQIVTTAKIQEE